MLGAGERGGEDGEQAASQRAKRSLAERGLHLRERAHRLADGSTPLVGEADELRPPIVRVGSAHEVAELLEIDDELGHRLLGDARLLGELGQSYALEGDVRHQVVVHDTVVIEPGSDEVRLERLRQVTLGEGD